MNIPYAPKAAKIIEKVKSDNKKLLSEQAPPKEVKQEIKKQVQLNNQKDKLDISKSKKVPVPEKKQNQIKLDKSEAIPLPNKKTEKIETKQEMLIERKKRTQPNQIKTCGSTFKNSENKKAWELIKDSGCSNLSVGDAKISNKHCNFFLNAGNAKTLDIENLINKVKKEGNYV